MLRNKLVLYFLFDLLGCMENNKRGTVNQTNIVLSKRA